MGALQRDAPVFVCSEASHMAPDVKQAFVELFCKRTGASATDGNARLTRIVASQRYLEDIWASSAPVSGPFEHNVRTGTGSRRDAADRRLESRESRS